MRPAVFLDRDGTLIESVDYLVDPADVRLLPGAADALVALRSAGFACVLVTNQSAIARGMLSIEGLHEVQAELGRQLDAAGARLDAWYFSPDAPRGGGYRHRVGGRGRLERGPPRSPVSCRSFLSSFPVASTGLERAVCPCVERSLSSTTDPRCRRARKRGRRSGRVGHAVA